MNLASPERIIFGAILTSGVRLPIPLTCRRTARTILGDEHVRSPACRQNHLALPNHG